MSTSAVHTAAGDPADHRAIRLADRLPVRPADPLAGQPADADLTPDLTADLTADLLEGLDADQVAAVLADVPVLAVVAGAGSGKTRVLTRRIARRLLDGSADARHVLALTFTRKAAGELRSRLAVLAGHRPHGEGAPAVHTFHAFGGALLQRWWLDRGERPWDVARHRRALLERALRESAGRESGGAELSARALGAEIEWAKARLLEPDTYEAGVERAGVERKAVERPGVEREGVERKGVERAVDTSTVAAAWRAYEAEKRSGRVLDVDDLIAWPARLLADDATFAAARRSWHRHVFVDEAQDLNPAQLRLVELVVGDEPDLCVVGDPDQAIYGWNGADPDLLAGLVTSLPSGAVRRLGTNHRCSAPIVAAAASILRAPSAPVAGHEDHLRWPTPTVSRHADEAAEADAIAHRLQEARWRGARGWSSMAVLVRTAAQLDVIAGALAARQIPHCLPGSLLDRQEVLAVLRALRAVDAARHLPLRQLAADLPDLCAKVLADLSPPFADLALADRAFADQVRADDVPGMTGPPPPGDVSLLQQPLLQQAPLQQAHLDALVELVDEFAQAVPAGDLDAFRSWARGVLGARGAEQSFDRQGVTLTTLHRSKGLEWRVVVVAGCETGLLPHWRSTSPGELAEERRLAYVAATRASEELHLTWAERRSTAHGVRGARRSPFLDDLERSVAPEVDEDVARAERLAGLRAARAALVPRPAADRP